MTYRESCGQYALFAVSLVVAAVLALAEAPLALFGVLVGLSTNRHPKYMRWNSTRFFIGLAKSTNV